MAHDDRSSEDVTEIYGPEEQVLVLSEQLHNRRQSPFADSEMGEVSDPKTSNQFSESDRTLFILPKSSPSLLNSETSS